MENWRDEKSHRTESAVHHWKRFDDKVGPPADSYTPGDQIMSVNEEPQGKSGKEAAALDS